MWGKIYNIKVIHIIKGTKLVRTFPSFSTEKIIKKLFTGHFTGESANRVGYNCVVQPMILKTAIERKTVTN